MMPKPRELSNAIRGIIVHLAKNLKRSPNYLKYRQSSINDLDLKPLPNCLGLGYCGKFSPKKRIFDAKT